MFLVREAGSRDHIVCLAYRLDRDRFNMSKRILFDYQYYDAASESSNSEADHVLSDVTCIHKVLLHSEYHPSCLSHSPSCKTVPVTVNSGLLQGGVADSIAPEDRQDDMATRNTNCPRHNARRRSSASRAILQSKLPRRTIIASCGYRGLGHDRQAADCLAGHETSDRQTSPRDRTAMLISSSSFLSQL
jgi:hypothetical protein